MREDQPTIIGAVDLRPPLFVGMRVSFVPDTLTFSRKHSCLHSCSLGRDTHYSPLSPSFARPSPPPAPPCLSLSLFVTHLSAAGCHTSSPERARARSHACVRACVSRERRLNAPLSVQTRMRVRSECRRGGHPAPPAILSSLAPLSSSLPSHLPPARVAHPARSARLCTLRDVRLCQWNTLSLSRGQTEGGRARERERDKSVIEERRVTVVVGLPLVWWRGKLSRWLLVAHWRCTEAFDLSSSLSSSLSLSLCLAPSFSVSSFNRSFLPNSPAPLPASRSPLVCPLWRARAHASDLRVARHYPCESPPPPTHTHGETRTEVRPSALCACSSGFDPARLHDPPFLPRQPPLPRHPSIVPRSVLPSPPSLSIVLPGDVARPAFIPQQNLHDSTPVDDKRNRALSAL